MNELISVIMPVWKPNLDQFNLAVNSILSQTYSNIEFLIMYKKNIHTNYIYNVWKL